MSSFPCCARLPVACALLLCACGGERILEPPCSAAQLRIVEIMADPVGPDVGHEWLELSNWGERGATLEGLGVVVLSGGRRRAITVQTPHVLPPGGRWVLGHAAGGAPPVDYGYGAALSLPNKQATVRLECGARLLDAVTYGSGGVPSPARGASLHGAAGRWCVAVKPLYDGKNAGTPGQPNPPCAAAAASGPPADGPSQGVAP